ncbi:MAG: EamA family transporter, partial [Acidimicrobiales bacterium]
GHSPPVGGDLWRFALVGAIAPGSSQGLFVASIGAIGPSRASVLVGTSPVFSVLLAIVFLDEGWRWAIVVGTLLTVVGGALISWEPGSIARRVGIAFALITAFTFGLRDVVARQFGSDSSVSSWWAGALVLGTAAVVLIAMVVIRDGTDTITRARSCLPEFAASGLAIGVALPVLLEALDRGEVGVVAPLSLAAQNITVLALGAVVFGRQERTPRVVMALLLVLLGATLIMAT